MTRTSVPGNESNPKARGKPDHDKSDRGFALTDALLCLFICGIIFGIAANSQAVRKRVLTELTEHTGRLIEERNRIDGERTDIK
ncbi:MAG: hypothetical protein LBE17_09730 [Treponema sp.]|jgi:hypothetical protein|nr:hypothetical protein [Treponema sp.]